MNNIIIANISGFSAHVLKPNVCRTQVLVFKLFSQSSWVSVLETDIFIHSLHVEIRHSNGHHRPSFNQVPVAQWENSWLVCIWSKCVKMSQSNLKICFWGDMTWFTRARIYFLESDTAPICCKTADFQVAMADIYYFNIQFMRPLCQVEWSFSSLYTGIKACLTSPKCIVLWSYRTTPDKVKSENWTGCYMPDLKQQIGMLAPG